MTKEYTPSEITRIVILGTGTPNPDPERSGNSLAIVVNDTPYIIDFGPGLIRRAAAMTPLYGGKIKGLEAENIKRAFLTHLHSDHTTGYPDLIFTPWVMGRDEPLEVYGPEGIAHMTKHILAAYKADINIRLYGIEPANNKGWRVNTHNIKEGEIYKDQNVRVEAFKVLHGSWPESYGFKFYTPDRVIVISGDTRPCKKLLQACRDVDILIHEVYSQVKLTVRTPFWKSYHPQFHTSTVELAEIANQVKPKLLILYHQLYWGATDEELVKEITDRYKGKVVSAKDLEVY
ncbi:MAG: MBL fold metallo-hydrolase [bacterium]|nr:MBL fold metallo-hydrolase [bacterium]